MVKELNINDTIIRRGTLKEEYNVKEKKLINNILHYIIQSKTSNYIVLSEYAIAKDFISSNQDSKNYKKEKFINLFKKQIKKILPSRRK